MDKLFRRYPTRRRTSRRPHSLFFNIEDIAALAAYIIHTPNNDMVRHVTGNRRLCLRELDESLTLPAIEDRSLNIQAMRHFSTKRELKVKLKKIFVRI